jgi:trigger factor
VRKWFNINCLSFFATVLIEQKIEPVAQPQITHLQFDEGTPLKFVATVEIKPVFELKNYKGLAVKKAKTEVTEQDVDKAVEDLRNQMAQLVPVDDGRPKATIGF